jgi:hypothetical protein
MKQAVFMMTTFASTFRQLSTSMLLPYGPYTLISSYDRNGQLAYQAAVETTSTFYERM